MDIANKLDETLTELEEAKQKILALSSELANVTFELYQKKEECNTVIELYKKLIEEYSNNE